MSRPGCHDRGDMIGVARAGDFVTKVSGSRGHDRIVMTGPGPVTHDFVKYDIRKMVARTLQSREKRHPVIHAGQSHLDLRMAPRTSWHALSGPPGPVRAIEGTKPDTQIRCTGPGGPLKACPPLSRGQA